MKAYTDLEQSNILAEFLPTESADMEYILEQWIDEKTYRHKEAFCEIPVVKVEDDCPLQPITLDCWSLAALLSILPIVYINNEKEVCGPLHIDITDSETPFVLWYANLFHKGNIIEIQTKEYDNLVDACVEMITKLHEQKLL